MDIGGESVMTNELSEVDKGDFRVFEGKSVLVTGHTGFKGSWLTVWLRSLGANVVGLALDPPTSPSHFSSTGLSSEIKDLRIDIRDRIAVEKALIAVKPDFVFHLAGQSLVREAYIDPIETWNINVLGTLNVLEALRKIENNCAAVIITSDKCYDNVEWTWGYREIDALGGIDPYSGSKAAAELAIRTHIRSFFSGSNNNVRIASARAGNVIGGGDWAENRIVPDCVKSWSLNSSVKLRNPMATRPWQHVLEPLSGYLTLAAKLNLKSELHGEAFNFGPSETGDFSVISLVEEMSIHWDKVKYEDISKFKDSYHESELLKLNCDKARHLLNWKSVMNFSETVKMTADWYKSFYANTSPIIETTENQITYYCNLAKERELTWAQ